MNSWDRQPKETAYAYEAFTAYLDLRSNVKVAERLGRTKDSVDKHAQRYHWPQRLRDYDAYMRRVADESKKKEIEEMNRRQVQQGMLMQKVATDRLQEIIKSDESISVKLLVSMIMRGAEMERRARLYGVVDETEDKGGKSTNGVLESILEMERDGVE